MPSPFTTLFVDVGGVLLTAAWDHIARHRAVKQFELDQEALERRHHLVFDLYEEGKLSLDEYLDRTVFYENRPFSRHYFQAFMFSQSEARPQMIELVRNLKARHGLKVVAISNEGLELAAHRIEKCELRTFVDLFMFSCFVRCRKPDLEIYQMALDIAQVPPEAVVCIEDERMFAEAAKSLGICAFSHFNDKFARDTLATFGLSTDG